MPLCNRRLLPLGTAVVTAAALALAGAIAASGSTQRSHRPRTIVFTVKQTGGFFPHGQPSPGSVLGFTEIVQGSDGSKGVADVLCTLITPNDRLCNIQFRLTSGQLALQGVAHAVNRNTPITVVGGTGAYAVARGAAAVTDVNQSTTRLTVKLAA